MEEELGDAEFAFISIMKEMDVPYTEWTKIRTHDTKERMGYSTLLAYMRRYEKEMKEMKEKAERDAKSGKSQSEGRNGMQIRSDL